MNQKKNLTNLKKDDPITAKDVGDAIKVKKK